MEKGEGRMSLGIIGYFRRNAILLHLSTFGNQSQANSVCFCMF